jgi:hypothetical protein
MLSCARCGLQHRQWTCVLVHCQCCSCTMLVLQSVAGCFMLSLPTSVVQLLGGLSKAKDTINPTSAHIMNAATAYGCGRKMVQIIVERIAQVNKLGSSHQQTRHTSCTTLHAACNAALTSVSCLSRVSLPEACQTPQSDVPAVHRSLSWADALACCTW